MKKHINRLMAATDLSAPARHAVARAAMIAKEINARLDLVHVAPMAPVERMRFLAKSLSSKLEEQLLDTAREEMRLLAESIMLQYDITPSVHVLSGPQLQTLSDHADGTKADLFVLGARGVSFLRHFLLGSTADRMIRKTMRPLLVVKQTPFEAYRRILIPVDFSPYSLPAIRNARAIAPNAHLVLIHVFNIPMMGRLRFANVDEEALSYYRTSVKEEAKQRMEALCLNAKLPEENVTSLILHGDPSLNILEQEQEQGCDLIVMGKHGESVVEDLLLGSVTKHVLSESNGDVLISI